jgi:membrane protease YdiL (CAAX protease family)
MMNQPQAPTPPQPAPQQPQPTPQPQAPAPQQPQPTPQPQVNWQPQALWQPLDPIPLQPQRPSGEPELSRAGLKRTLNRVCLTYAGFMVAIIVIAMIVAMAVAVVSGLAGNLGGLLEGGATNPSELLADPDFERSVNDAIGDSATLAQLLAVALGATLFFIIRGKRLLTSDITTRRQSPKATTLLALFALALGVQFFMMMINAALAPLMEQADISLTEAMEDSLSSFMFDPIGLLYVILLGPLCEEIVFRGAILRALEPYGANFAIVCSSILFGLYHIILYQAVFAFLLGLVLAYTAGRFSLKWALLLHVANNTLAMSSLLFTPLVGEEAYSFFLAILFFAGFLFSVFFLIYKRRVLVAQKAAGAPAVAQPFAVLFTRPAFLTIAAVILLFGVGSLFII